MIPWNKLKKTAASCRHSKISGRDDAIVPRSGPIVGQGLSYTPRENEQAVKQSEVARPIEDIRGA
ncbi:hypothetical protein, partial [Phyllobacterium sp. P5_D12]